MHKVSLPAFGLALALVFSPRVHAAESRVDSSQVEKNLVSYVQVVDSLQSVLGKWPKDSVMHTAPCTTTVTRFCAHDSETFAGYLKLKKEFAVSIQARLNGGVLRYVDYLDSVKPRLNEFLDREDRFSGKLAKHPVSKREAEAYNLYVQPLLAKSFLSYTTAANTLIQAKYFSQNDEGNFLEGYFNSRFGFTRTEPDPAKAGLKNFGVSPWEVVMRVEPIYILGDNDIQNFGGVFSTGVLMHFLPSVTVADDLNGTVKVKKGFASSVLQDMGVKLGIGAHSDKLHWSAGGAVQVASFSLWGLYTWQEDRFDLALGLSDLAVVKALLPIYRKF